MYTTHGDRCYICTRPIDLASFHVDHVIPVSLLDDSNRLAGVLRDLGRTDDFDLNSFANWLPACPPCNTSKNALVWEPSLLVQKYLQAAGSKAEQARQRAEKVVRNQEIGKVLNTLFRVHEQGGLDDETKAQLAILISDYSKDHAANAEPDVVRLTPTYTAPLFEILSDNGTSRVVRGPYGTGGGPSQNSDPRLDCSACGYSYFNGVRCVICGNMDDD
ncbi:HNH endonuclease signature motif containing protein [Aeromicrobium alkaliterrae]|uniref:HNH endonuclease n=1 Tax=Aeromicrobium alkaliterrae TaxID=302168 RepID=UPI0031D5C4D6